MPTRRTPQLAGVAAILAVGLITGIPGPADASASASLHVVHPGESIQQAINAARPGDTVQILAGTYRESVVVTTSELTLRGAGEATVISPGPDTQSGNACARAGHGLCVTGASAHPVTGLRIESLTVAGFTKNGINAVGTDRMTIRHVLARDNGQQGISQEKSTRAVVRGNEARGNGQAGVFLANLSDGEGPAIDTQGTVIAENRLSDNRLGVVVRRARVLSVESNVITGNCGGVFIVGDENVPRAGALTVRQNFVSANNKYCPPNPRLDAIQGTGILLTGAEDTLVTGNRVEENVGSTSMSGGIVLFHSFVGTPNARITVSNNAVLGNGPSDVANRDTGVGNSFTRNQCRVSEPAGQC
ncbi:right-handed parallel beta-helix repeat-containing protein [Kitasatospora sp. GP82]|uniref:right-handed parallel beta-helix repeat-containing protein n=1 Tax=Kitasatospora sp. GP82 TaxID=3035089 RepID=UPI002473C8BA|nr:right-handed parallel beta-helix repeat-containing protein [Kitasatospora sp. GP82]MDH6124965.1 nitrous oxidase accessory protein NosD [Kitasatospora sp. GP82]